MTILRMIAFPCLMRSPISILFVTLSFISLACAPAYQGSGPDLNSTRLSNLSAQQKAAEVEQFTVEERSWFTTGGAHRLGSSEYHFASLVPMMSSVSSDAEASFQTARSWQWTSTLTFLSGVGFAIASAFTEGNTKTGMWIGWGGAMVGGFTSSGIAGHYNAVGTESYNRDLRARYGVR